MVYNYRLAFKPTTPLIFLKRLKERKMKDKYSSFKGGLNILCLFLICLLLKALPCSNEPSLSTNLLWGSRWFYTQPKWWSNHTWWFENWSLHKDTRTLVCTGLHKDTSELHIRDTEPAAFTSLLEYIYLPQVPLLFLCLVTTIICALVIFLSKFPVDNSLSTNHSQIQEYQKCIIKNWIFL